MSLSAGSKLGPYEILAPIGAGGMGQVYRARDPRMGREVAIKVSGERFTERFSREVHAIAALNQPNICHLYDVGPDYLVMELVEGTTLAEEIRHGAIPLDEALKIARQIAAALEAAHEKGITHRDLKPGNVMLKPDGSVKVLDFGLAKFGGTPTAPTEDSPTVSMMATQAGVILGTAAYMSPEQAKGKSVDKRADIWGFGVVLYEMLTGKRLFTGETTTEVLGSVLKEDPDFSRIPDRVRPLLRACLEKDPKRRLRDIGDIELLLAGQVSDLPQRAGGLLRWVAWTAAGVFAIALAALAFVHFREKPPAVRSVRFEVRMPDKSGAAFFKLSPNGELMVIADTATHKLEIRSLNSLEFRTLAGTDNATYPFWSPDSASIGFFAGGKLKKISVNGGPVQTLCDAPNGRGGTWNSDGVIVFSPDPNLPLQRVGMSGGTPTAVTKLGEDSEDDRFPEFLPDRRHFLYTVNGPAEEANGIYAGSLQGESSVRIFPDITSAVYVPPAVSSAATSGPGYLLFRRETTLMAAAFDAERLQVAGEVFPVAEPVGISANVAYAAFSASMNGVLAYNSGGLVERELVWVDRAGKRLRTVGKSGAITYVALSPDEKTVAYVVSDGNDHSDIWLYDLNRDSASRFTFGTGRVTSPIWSPDGRRIAYGASPTTFGKGDIFQKPAAGGKEELLQRPGTLGSQLILSDWSPDGKTIVFSPEISLGKTRADLFLLPMEGVHTPSVYLQTPSVEIGGQYSPDGRWMAYTTDESGRQEVNVQPVPPTGAKWQVSTAGGLQARWRRDGKELFYLAADQKLMAVPVKTGPSFQAGSPQELFPDAPIASTVGVGQFFYTPSKDGQRFLMSLPAEGAASQPPITVVLNWQSELKK
jgi:WD40 repeat protein/predicted Ser/Thr protein kinase